MFFLFLGTFYRIPIDFMGKSIWLEEPGGSSVFIGLSNAEEPGFIRSS